MKKINISLDKVVPIGLGVLTVAQMLLSNKKDSIDRAALKNDILKEVMEELPKKN